MTGQELIPHQIAGEFQRKNEPNQTRYVSRSLFQQKSSRRQLSVIFIVQRLELDSFERHVKTKDDANEKLFRK